VKSLTRKNTYKQTKEKRKSQTCKVYQLKIDVSHCSKYTLHHLNMLFIEAKWLYNHIVALPSAFSFDPKTRIVDILNKNKLTEKREINFLSSQMKREIWARIKKAIISLASMKKRGILTGRVEFKSKVNSIPLIQPSTEKITGGTHKIVSPNRIRIQGIPEYLKVHGLEQIPKDAEIANANIIKINTDFFIQITTFLPKKELSTSDLAIGIDFGCSTQLTLSNGIKIKYEVPVSKKIKQIDKAISRSIKLNKSITSNRIKLHNLKEKEYKKLNNKKSDIKNKILNILISNYKIICFQDESIRGWRSGGHGKKILNTAIGGIIADLKTKSHTPIMVGKFFPSTQICIKCKNRQKLNVSIRVYECPVCKYKEDRDVNAAKNILNEGIRIFTIKDKTLAERKDDSMEVLASAKYILDILRKIPNVIVSFTDEVECRYKNIGSSRLSPIQE
jgi:putative transposase